MEEWRQIIRSFSELRDQYPDIETALEMVCVTTKSDIEEVLSVLSMTGVYVPPGPEEDEIKCFINSAGKTKTVSELVRAVGFTFVRNFLIFSASANEQPVIFITIRLISS